MMLLIDVGNTQTVIGLAENGEDIGGYSAKWRISTDKSATSDDILSKIAPLFENRGSSLDSVQTAAICSVVPELEDAWASCIGSQCSIDTIRCSANTAHSAGLFDCDYPRPEEIGADRIADAIAAKAEFGSPVVVVDFGTATNMEVIDRDGRFIGGMIAPGIATSSTALLSNASKISSISLDAPRSAIGRSTQEALSSGVVLGQVRMVDGLLDAAFDELGYRAPAIGTGGLVDVVGTLCRNITEVHRDLTLDGLALLAHALS